VRTLILLGSIALAVAGCSHADESATSPRPQAAYVVPTGAADIDAQAQRFCSSYHSQPAALVDHSGGFSRYECTGRARGGESFFVERMGL
jgi:hypothetical protein